MSERFTNWGKLHEAFSRHPEVTNADRLCEYMMERGYPDTGDANALVKRAKWERFRYVAANLPMVECGMGEAGFELDEAHPVAAAELAAVEECGSGTTLGAVQRKGVKSLPVTEASHFATCDRDEGGRCLPLDGPGTSALQGAVLGTALGTSVGGFAGILPGLVGGALGGAYVGWRNKHPVKRKKESAALALADIRIPDLRRFREAAIELAASKTGAEQLVVRRLAGQAFAEIRSRETRVREAGLPAAGSFRCAEVYPIREAAAGDDGGVDVSIITEGFGNSRDKHYYSPELLRRVLPLFQGVRSYRNHPTLTEDEERPERSVEDLVGYFSNVRMGKVKGKAALIGRFNYAKGKLGEQAKDAIATDREYRAKNPDSVFVGFSLNAVGPSHPDIVQGRECVVVDDLARVDSVDLVTVPGRGGMALYSEAA